MLVARQMFFAITGRMKEPAVKKLNPIWWFGNDDEQQTADWYHPEWPRWRRDFYWNFLRNPLQNFRCFVIGVQDRNYTVTGRAPVMTVQRDDLGPPERGFQWCVIHTLIPLGFLSYSGKHVVWYIGWQPRKPAIIADYVARSAVELRCREFSRAGIGRNFPRARAAFRPSRTAARAD